MSGNADNSPLLSNNWEKALSIPRWRRRYWPILRFVSTSPAGPQWEANQSYTFNLLFVGFLPISKWNVRVEVLDPKSRVLRLEQCGGIIRRWVSTNAPKK